ncbi:hypothetical protein MC885_011171, partial [Smutsia gigantea]
MKLTLLGGRCTHACLSAIRLCEDRQGLAATWNHPKAANASTGKKKVSETSSLALSQEPAMDRRLQKPRADLDQGLGGVTVSPAPRRRKRPNALSASEDCRACSSE